MHPSEGIKTSTPKAWNFTKQKLRHRCLDDNLQKIFQTNILESGIGQALLIVVLRSAHVETIN